MAVRAARIIDDLQRCIHGLIKELNTTTAPWTSWSLVFGFPTTDVFEQFTKPFIYVLSPVRSNEYRYMGSQTSLGLYEMIIGVWDDRKTGGSEEINIMASTVQNLFDDRQTANTTTFDVTLASAVTDTTLVAQGIRAVGITGARDIATEDKLEFRKELTLYLKA